ncbi:TusE/DsrC/DsvC family sulfur relay protein [Bermanella marisrubri]|uniref:Sulfurtransferase n=1 Tax=Bermanella marisrubri TaxID=207949 RepID=Q1N6X5_9GAMM|nr:TusE/DsrC/DsvC family sulfur relay protein [Bermanella marisrubri]EAT13467.1 DsrC-like protein [Oceanobacter sp. RED65] [Bermanella marisrubri]QIZ84270.1 TusE/DsrC/DsvC family sulfur relay protein [Bermanella marisrubri]
MSNPKFDQEGFLVDLNEWSTELASAIAQQEGIELKEEHLEIIHLLRQFYESHQVAPSNRPFVKLIKNELGADKGNSIYLMQLFPESPAKIAAKIAGLPKPPNCF